MKKENSDFQKLGKVQLEIQRGMRDFVVTMYPRRTPRARVVTREEELLTPKDPNKIHINFQQPAIAERSKLCHQKILCHL